jgi:hypothetical protein
MQTYRVIRQHFGDRMYMPGDTREAEPRDVAHLVEGGTLEPVKTKAEPAAPRNKAEPAARNKADKG